MCQKMPLDHICWKSFSDFLDSEKYDKAEKTLFAVIRQAFLAGWDTADKNRIGMLPKEKK